MVTVDDGAKTLVDSVWSSEDKADDRVAEIDDEEGGDRIGEVHAADLDVAPEAESGEDEE